MGVLETLRDATTRLISENPVEITVHRVTYIDDGAGGRLKEETDLAPFVGRLVASRRDVRSLAGEAGAVEVARFLLIAPHTADLRAGSDVEDTFEVGGRQYRIRQVIPRAWQGDVYAVHAAVEEVS